MTSRFVSGGTIAGDDGEPQQSASVPPSSKTQEASETQKWDKETIKRNAEWEAVQRDLEADRRRREEARRAQVEGGPGGENKTLFDILQANKAAKQAAFEEKTRISNQFRALDDDEIDFLESMRDEQRVEEERVKRETEERLASFRQAQKATGTAASSGGAEDGDAVHEGIGDDVGTWSGGAKKRKRPDKEVKTIVKGVKRRASGSEKEVERAAAPGMRLEGPKAKTESKPIPNVRADSDPKSSRLVEEKDKTDQEKPKPKPKSKLGLVDYGSDEDDED
ncbi:hypothetical protein F4813DRAFT_184919 [Daldinia decipiens]|uniref:uncharacterized protein n=1 Tax=Daldinia decipiens TaxID=326647 RepID=UPI0020C57396|nr:uncharacterized protein F4813DRAFT_184919 [Daldinia decipiens]KAI1655233.1 hypothetical protein F4813DRAFT_184919 [Daldinia decipiens]